LSETPESVQVRMDLPGIKPDDVNIEIAGNTLRITGERKEEKDEKNKTYHRVERRFGSFSRSVSLPCSVKEAAVNAEHANGVLTVTLPKSEEAKSHKIKVKAK
jgi:HSP20 family protein